MALGMGKKPLKLTALRRLSFRDVLFSFGMISYIVEFTRILVFLRVSLLIEFPELQL